MKEIVLIRKLLKDHRAENWLPHLEEINLDNEFKPLYTCGWSLQIANGLTAFIIYAYCYQSQWIDLRQDRFENKRRIMSSLGMDPDGAIYHDVVEGNNEEVQEVIINYLLTQPDWRWTTVVTYFDYHAKMIRFGNERTPSKSKTGTRQNEKGEKEDEFEFFDMDKQMATNKKKGELLKEAVERRKEGETILQEIRRDYVNMDTITEGEFGFKATDNVDIMSWRGFIRKRKKEKAAK